MPDSNRGRVLNWSVRVTPSSMKLEKQPLVAIGVTTGNICNLFAILGPRPPSVAIDVQRNRDG